MLRYGRSRRAGALLAGAPPSPAVVRALCHDGPMSVAVLAGLAAALVVASSVQAVTGFGFSLLSMPLLAMVIGAKDAVAVASLVGAIGSTLLFVRHRRQVCWSLVGPLMAGATLGMPLGLVVLLAVSGRTLQIVVALTVLGFVGLLARGWSLEGAGRRVDVLAGFASGVLNTSVSTNGPPLVLALQARGLDPDAFRGTISAVFAGSAVVGVGLFAAAGRYTPAVLTYAACGPPTLAIGNLIGRRLGRRLTRERFRPVVLALLVAASLSALISALTG